MWFRRTAWFWKSGFLAINLMLALVIPGCKALNDSAGQEDWENTQEGDRETAEQWEKGYDLPIDRQEREEAERDCMKVMELIDSIYEQADKGEASNTVLSDETVLEMQKKVRETECPVHTTILYSDMENNKKMEAFLKACLEGKVGSIVTYEIHSDGGIRRRKYTFDGTDMYVLSTNAVWNQENKPVISDVSYTRIKEWRYSDKGWFCYELCVPEYPEVSEMVDGSCLIRVKPMNQKQREMSEKCVLGLGYQGNNLLCTNWDTDHLDKLDYNGMYEYLYGMKYGEQFEADRYPEGIPKEEFEGLIMEFLPVTSEQIRQYAVFDEERQTYTWARLGCFNYTLNFFGTSFPEVTGIRENADGTVTLTVDAVCEMVLCNEAVITHELTVKFDADGSFHYLGNKILNDGINDIPAYEYRLNGNEPAFSSLTVP